MALWRKFSNILKNKRSSFSRSFTSDVFGQLQHWTLPEPARSDLVGLVLSSISISPVAEIRSGILSSDAREIKCLGMCILCLHQCSSLLYRVFTFTTSKGLLSYFRGKHCWKHTYKRVYTHFWSSSCAGRALYPQAAAASGPDSMSDCRWERPEVTTSLSAGWRSSQKHEGLWA